MAYIEVEFDPEDYIHHISSDTLVAELQDRDFSPIMDEEIEALFEACRAKDLAKIEQVVAHLAYERFGKVL